VSFGWASQPSFPNAGEGCLNFVSFGWASQPSFPNAGEGCLNFVSFGWASRPSFPNAGEGCPNFVSFGWAVAHECRRKLPSVTSRCSKISIPPEHPRCRFLPVDGEIAPFATARNRRSSCSTVAHDDKRIVYIIRSSAHPTRHYVGITTDVTRRLAVHNSGGSAHTANLRPWELVAAVEFASEASAIAFEQYLKSGPGRAFAKRHFV